MSIKSHIAGYRKHWNASFYDLLLWLTFPERKLKNEFLNKVPLTRHDDVLDFGCGTGTLLLMMKKICPEVKLIGIDTSRKMIHFANNKIKNAHQNITVFVYDGENLPFITSSFDQVVSSFVFHHLHSDLKKNILKDLLKVLKPGSNLYILDFGKPKTFLANAGFQIIRYFDGYRETFVNAKGLLSEFIRAAGFEKIKETKPSNTIWGSVYIWIATRPDIEFRVEA